MPKKVIKTTTTTVEHSSKPKKKTNKSVKKTKTPSTKLKLDAELQETLVHNLIELQKIHINIAEKFDKLSKEISQILALFEVTARNFAKNAPMGEYEKDKDFLTKIDKLLDQNKLLAKGLSIMEERLRERMYGPGHPGPPEKQSEETFQPSMASKRPLPKF
jgi:hypothetical protein